MSRTLDAQALAAALREGPVTLTALSLPETGLGGGGLRVLSEAARPYGALTLELGSKGPQQREEVAWAPLERSGGFWSSLIS